MTPWFPVGPVTVTIPIIAGFGANDFYAGNEGFGFLNSDELYLGERQQVLGAFMRCDRGETYVDHHSFLAIGAGMVALNHVAFEVQDMDDLMGRDEIEFIHPDMRNTVIQRRQMRPENYAVNSPVD